MGMLQLLETTDQTEEQNEYTYAAIRSSKRLTRLLTDILDLSRVEAGKLVIEEGEIETHQLRESGLELFMTDAAQKGLYLDIWVDDRLPSILIGDETRVRQILFNLVGNAIKFTAKGSVRVDVQPLPHRKGGMLRVLICVSDTGMGISDEQLGRIFHPFTQVEGAYTRHHQGAGLGLSIVRRLVLLIGGEISVESTVGEGTTFYVSLPFKLPNKISASKGNNRYELPSLSEGLKVLLVEDEAINRIACSKLLKKSGYIVTSAVNGQEALDHLSKEDFDLILMDIQMPVMDGMEATKSIRRSSFGGAKTNIPIIAMTAYAMAGDKEKFLSAGMDDYISKPVDIGILRETIERVMSRQSDTLKGSAILEI
jgi:CheY-like chemotaxis protein/anti-sigma regulatory factor (Ser/Thr protein kinase)